MKRKIIKLGTSTLVTSLPSNWAKKLHLQAGDEIEVQEQGLHLILAPEFSHQVEKVTLDVRNIDLLMKRLLVAQYYKGCDEIEVKFNSREKAKTIQTRVNELLGVTIMHQGSDFCLIKDLGSSEQDINEVLKRIFLLITNMIEESLSALEKGETQLEIIADIESNINKFTDYAFRLLNKKLSAPALYCIVDLAEKLGDDDKAFLKLVSESKFKFSNDLLKVYRSLLSWFKSFQSFFFCYSKDKAVALAKERDKIAVQLHSLKSRSKNTLEVEVLLRLEIILEDLVRMMGHTLTLN
ncbi:MAG: hypothetical protein AABX70_06030 [Nanoarchaeota archaeon]